MQDNAAGTLRHLALDDDLKRRIVAAGALPPLVALLGPRNKATVQELAAGALCRLAYDDDIKMKLVGAGALYLPPGGVVGPSAHLGRAAGVLARLADADAIKAQLVVAGALPPLVALLGPQHAAAVHLQALGALVRLAGDDDINVRIVAAGALPPWWRFWALNIQRW